MAVAALLVLAVRRAPVRCGQPGHGAAVAAVLGTQSGLLDQTVGLFATEGIAALTSWVPSMMATASLVGLLGETIDTTGSSVIALAIGAVVLVTGIVVLDISPAVRQLHEAQRGATPSPETGTTAPALACRGSRRYVGMVPGTVPAATGRPGEQVSPSAGR